MVKEVPGGRGGMIKILEKGETANPNGRPKSQLRKLTDLIEEQYDIKLSKSDAKKLLDSLMFMSSDELATIEDNNDAPFIFKVIIKAMRSDYDKGMIVNTNPLLDRAFGKPLQAIEAKVENTLDVNVPSRVSEKEWVNNLKEVT